MIQIPPDILEAIREHAEWTYPEEGAGLLLGMAQGEDRCIVSLMPLTNAREGSSRRSRYLITAQDMLQGEAEAARQGLDVIGVFHSHPDHPEQPSEFDQEWALPWFSYIITSVFDGEAQSTRSWRLAEDRSGFSEETLVMLDY
jgi:proteasome lid subunit RPN8/RPN11